MLHVGTEGLFDAQGHFRRELGLAVEKVRERGLAHVQDLRRLRDVQGKGFNDFGSDQAARMGRVFHGHCILLMAVDQVNMAGGVRLLVVAKNQAPVSGHGQAPASSHLALKRVQLPSRKPVMRCFPELFIDHRESLKTSDLDTAVLWAKDLNEGKPLAATTDLMNSLGVSKALNRYSVELARAVQEAFDLGFRSGVESTKSATLTAGLEIRIYRYDNGWRLKMTNTTYTAVIATLTLSFSAWCAGPTLKPDQIQAAIEEGSKYKTADRVLDCLDQKYVSCDKNLKGKRVRLASAMAADGISKYATFYNDWQAVVAQAAAAHQQMREIKPADVESKGLLHVFVEIHARGAHGTGKLDRRYSEQRSHLVLQIGDRVIQPLDKNMVARTGQNDASYLIGVKSGEITLEYNFDVTPQDLQSPVGVILIDGDGHKHTHEADLSGVLDVN